MTINRKLILLCAIPVIGMVSGVLVTFLIINRTDAKIGVCKDQYA